MMKNRLNEIFSNYLKILELKQNDLFYFLDKDNNIDYVFNTHEKYYPIIKEILEKFYDFETEIKQVIIEEIKSKQHYGKFYFPLRDLTEEEKFYIILKYGKAGEYLLEEKIND